MDWKEKATRLYFNEHLKIGEIAGRVGKSRQSVSSFLHGLEGVEAEKERRRQISAKRRARSKRVWEAKNRTGASAGSFGGHIDVLHECVRREHRQAVAELSRER